MAQSRTGKKRSRSFDLIRLSGKMLRPFLLTQTEEGVKQLQTILFLE